MWSGYHQPELLLLLRPPPVVVPIRLDDDGRQIREQGRDAATVVVYVNVYPFVASAIAVVDAVLFAVAAVVSVSIGSRAPLLDAVVVRIVLRTSAVNGTPAAEPRNTCTSLWISLYVKIEKRKKKKK